MTKMLQPKYSKRSGVYNLEVLSVSVTRKHQRHMIKPL